MNQDFTSLMGHWTQERNESDLEKLNTFRLRALRSIMTNELTPRQLYVMTEVFLKQRKMCELAQELGVNKSTISRTYNRAFNKLRKFAKYVK